MNLIIRKNNGGGGGGSPGGTTYSVQINDPAGTFFGDSNFTYNPSTQQIELTAGFEIDGVSLKNTSSYFFEVDGDAFPNSPTIAGLDGVAYFHSPNGNDRNRIFLGNDSGIIGDSASSAINWVADDGYGLSSLWEMGNDIGTDGGQDFYLFDSVSGQVAWQVDATGRFNIPWMTTDRAVITDGTSNLVPSPTTAVELGYVSGVTSSIQTQLNAKGTVSSVATNSSLTGGPITTTGTLGINLANANNWTATQTFSNATYAAIFGGPVGIGTAAPVAYLDIEGSVNGSFGMKIHNANTGTLAYTNIYLLNDQTGAGNAGAGLFMNSSTKSSDGGVNGLGFYNDYGGMRFRSSGGDLIFATQTFPGTDRMTIKNATGFIGLGTSSPASMFHLLSNSASTELKIIIENDATVGTPQSGATMGLIFALGSSSTQKAGYEYFPNSDGTFTAGITGAVTKIGNYGGGTLQLDSEGGSSNSISFQIGGVIKANIDNSGNFSLPGQTASTIASFDSSKNIVSLALATYPSLTELSYVKGVTSAIQAQITANVVVANSFSGVGVASTTFTVTIGTTQANTAYKVNVTPTNLLAAAVFYVNNKTTTSFDVVYLTGLTGTVTFDWALFK